VLIAPWADLSLQAPSITQKAKQDHIVTREYLDIVRKLYVPDTAMMTHPLVSPLYANFEGFPPALIQVGTNDLLHDDSLQLYEKMQAAGVKVSLEVWKNMPHVWHVIGDRLPEAGKALQSIAQFIKTLP
jgi:acetyl esterase/lipase